VTLTVGNAMVSTADGNNGGAGGDLNFDAGSGTVLQDVVVDASGLGASNVIRFGALTPTAFLGNDTVSGGAGGDGMVTAAGNDSLAGNAGGDALDGGSGNDTLNAGEGSDLLTGGAGGDLLQLGESALTIDTVRFTTAGDGSVDIDASVAESTADRITGFNATSDVVQLSRSGLGLGSGSVVSVPANGAWNIGTGAVFLFESNSANADTLAADNFGALAELASGINLDNAAGSGSSAGRTVALVISNLESSALRRTGIYTWTDSDGDSVLEASDVVRLLGVIEGVTANQLGADDILIVS
jgi:Ca2+-binding RTX toxin-like protein